jgi:hypothetical protein
VNLYECSNRVARSRIYLARHILRQPGIPFGVNFHQNLDASSWCHPPPHHFDAGLITSTTNEGNVRGEKFLRERTACPQIRAVTKDSHFTVLGFTAVTGEPVLMCAIIFAAKELAAA